MTIHTLAVGHSIPCEAGRYTVVFSRLEYVYRVEVHYGVSSQCVPELTRSYESGALAKAIARIIAVTLRASQDIDVTRRAVVDHLDGQLAFLLADPSPAAANAARELQMLKAGFASADEDIWAADMIRRLNADLDARARRAGVAS
jgi:hypothetical protein